MNASRTRLQTIHERSLRSPGVLSPCVSVCRMDASAELCVGCYRTLDEIAQWSTMAESTKAAVWQHILTREQHAKGVSNGQ
jgi:predicted Fe-S protein YdhL (DUF1289 family)